MSKVVGHLNVVNNRHAGEPRNGTFKTRILDFDIESRPLGWYGGEFVHQEVTAIASAWTDDPEGTLDILLLNKRAGSSERMLKAFLKRYNEAGMVTGHYIRGFDLPQINAACLEFNLPPLAPKLTHDTKGDLIRFQGVSKSQENLSSILGVSAPKVQMSQGDWRAANRLTEEGFNLVAERVGGDVLQHVELRNELLRRRMLLPPKQWTSGSVSEKYQA